MLVRNKRSIDVLVLCVPSSAVNTSGSSYNAANDTLGGGAATGAASSEEPSPSLREQLRVQRRKSTDEKTRMLYLETETRMLYLEEELLIVTGKREVEEHRRAVAEKAKRAEDQQRVVQEEQAAQDREKLAALVHSLQRDVQILEEKVCVEMKSLRAALEAAGAEKTKLEQTVVRSSVLLEKQARMVKELPTAVYV